MLRIRVNDLLAVALCFALAAQLSAAELGVCIECHGDDGMGKSEPAVPVIAGMPAAHIEEAIYAYVDGARQCVNEPRMCEAVKALSEAQVTAAAEYFAGQVRIASDEAFDAALAEKGAVLHEQHCGACHLEPDDEDVDLAIGIPLHGQRADYIRFAIKAYFAGSREPLLEKMSHELEQLDAEDLEALVNYYSSYRAGN